MTSRANRVCQPCSNETLDPKGETIGVQLLAYHPATVVVVRPKSLQDPDQEPDLGVPLKYNTFRLYRLITATGTQYAAAHGLWFCRNAFLLGSIIYPAPFPGLQRVGVYRSVTVLDTIICTSSIEVKYITIPLQDKGSRSMSLNPILRRRYVVKHPLLAF